MNDLPKMPERPTRPLAPLQENRAKNPLWLRILIWIGIGVVAFYVVPFVLLGIHPIVGGIYFAMMLLGPIAAFHYFVWGRWIGDAIRKEVAEEEAREAEQREREKLQDPK